MVVVVRDGVVSVAAVVETLVVDSSLGVVGSSKIDNKNQPHHA